MAYSEDFRRIPAMACPWCGYTFDAMGQSASLVCEEPQAGDVTVCMACAEVSVFTSRSALRRAVVHEMDAGVLQVQQDIRRMHARLN
jgi:hypothetical protein